MSLDRAAARRLQKLKGESSPKTVSNQQYKPTLGAGIKNAISNFNISDIVRRRENKPDRSSTLGSGIRRGIGSYEMPKVERRGTLGHSISATFGSNKGTGRKDSGISSSERLSYVSSDARKYKQRREAAFAKVHAKTIKERFGGDVGLALAAMRREARRKQKSKGGR